MKRILNRIKHLIYRRKELKLCLKIITDAKDYYIKNSYLGMCNAFNRTLFLNYFKYIEGIGSNNWIKNNIPEFNAEYLTGIKKSYNEFWWNLNDTDSRIAAFDKLINLYETKIKELYESRN